ncbi:MULTISPECIES: GntR family transcriptional regulator [Atopobiaceae]|uniref:GntR family transcriptional regulator n=1 Tax=Atopobiaceae TaxID=1643824 RepID=UPI00034E36DF|nr:MULTISPECIES: GntR family transcriptional regulator [Atopobiaceae]EPD78584.1 hypothetical protein HMPREF1527_00908 [Atopobium sp. oral taxon 199 str. F0494]
MTQQLYKEESKPLHMQVSDFIREKIYSKEWGVNTKIPSEYSLVKELGVSRGTVQKGIRALAGEGLLVQIRGKGTFITEPSLYHPAGGNLLSFAESLRMQGISFVTKVVNKEIIEADELTSEKLQIPLGSSTLFLRRLRLVNDEPALLMESKMSLLTCPKLDTYDFTKATLFSAIEETSKRRIGFAKQWHGARVAGSERGALLCCDEASPVLNIDQICYLENNVPAEWGNIWLPANRYVLSSVLQRA